MRVYEFAKEVSLSSKELLATLHKHGFDLPSHMSLLTEEMMNAVRRELAVARVSSSQSLQASRGVEMVSSPSPRTTTSQHAPSSHDTSSVVKDARATIEPTNNLEHKVMENPASAATYHKQTASSPRMPASRQHGRDRHASSANSARESHRDVRDHAQSGPKAVPAQPLRIEKMTVAAFAENARLPLGEVIGTLLRNGVLAPKNYVLSEDLVGTLARHYNVVTVTPEAKPVAASQEAFSALTSTAEGVVTMRPPIVVVMGHVDHGKTTLLDTIRKTRVAAREKGGITQHLGAYEAITPQGKIVFLDTPGHEAFSMIRTRGARVADIAILVVAADDGMKPQTLEALRVIKQAHIPCIVALNKIDKVAPAQLDIVKRELTQHGLIPEEWGGDTTVMPLSAKQGQGVDALLDVIILQSQLLELHVRTDIPARGIVIESRMERGLGSVGNVLIREGTLRVGDHFVVGSTTGRVSSMHDAWGKRVQAVLPAIPVSVAGFDAMPHAGDELIVVSGLAERRAHEATSALRDREKIKNAPTMDDSQERILKVIVKSDTVSSLEAIITSLQRLGTEKGFAVQLLHSGLGTISESDVDLAFTTGSSIYGFHIKIEPKAMSFAQHEGVDVRLFDIIYKMLDDVAARMKIDVAPTKTLKKIGEAVVLKVFDVKKMGMIAGSQVKSGIFTRDGVVKIYRGKHMVGEGNIKSLQRDRKVVKEVHTGFECAFMVDGFNEWEEGDRVECYQLQ